MNIMKLICFKMADFKFSIVFDQSHPVNDSNMLYKFYQQTNASAKILPHFKRPFQIVTFSIQTKFYQIYLDLDEYRRTIC